MYERKRYLLWKIWDLHEIANGGSGIEEVGGDSFSNAFGLPFKFALLYDVWNYKKNMYLIGIPQWSCLYQLCENVTFLATGVNKVLKNNCQCHLMIKWMYDVCTLYVHTCCEICFSIDINIPDNIEIIESPNEDSTNNDDDHHDNQSDQPKKSVRL